MQRPDKAVLNAPQPPEFRNENFLAATLKTLLFFTALMITVPIGLYFTTKSYIFGGALGCPIETVIFMPQLLLWLLFLWFWPCLSMWPGMKAHDSGVKANRIKVNITF